MAFFTFGKGYRPFTVNKYSTILYNCIFCTLFSNPSMLSVGGLDDSLHQNVQYSSKKIYKWCRVYLHQPSFQYLAARGTEKMPVHQDHKS